MADQVVAITIGHLLAALVVLGSVIAGLCVWIFHNTVANLRNELLTTKEEFIRLVESQNNQLTEAIDGINEAFAEADKLQRDIDKQVYILRERTAMLFKLSSKS
jgi:hypothetical protein